VFGPSIAIAILEAHRGRGVAEPAAYVIGATSTRECDGCGHLRPRARSPHDVVAVLARLDRRTPVIIAATATIIVGESFRHLRLLPATIVAALRAVIIIRPTVAEDDACTSRPLAHRGRAVGGLRLLAWRHAIDPDPAHSRRRAMARRHLVWPALARLRGRGDRDADGEEHDWDESGHFYDLTRT
jgi:hypothetical protein